jgi:hypothetical protein
MENVVFNINPADLQFSGSFDESKAVSGVIEVLILALIILVAMLFLWNFLKKPTPQIVGYETESTIRVL